MTRFSGGGGGGGRGVASASRDTHSVPAGSAEMTDINFAGAFVCERVFECARI